MGCAPSKQNAETDGDDKPYSPKDKKKGSGKNSTPNDGDVSSERIEEPKVVPATESAVSRTPTRDSNANDTKSSGVKGGKPTDSKASLNGPVVTSQQNGDVTVKEDPPMDRLHFLGSGDQEGAPPKPRRTFHTPDRRVNWTDDDIITRRDDNSAYFTFPRSRPARRAQSMRERCYVAEEKGTAPEEDGLLSLRDKTIERRKDLDYCSSAVYLGNTVSPPGRGRKILRLEFLSPERPTIGTYIPRGNVQDMAKAYQRMTLVLNSPPPPPIRSPKPGDTDLEDGEGEEAKDAEDSVEKAEGEEGVEAEAGKDEEEEEGAGEGEPQGERVSIIEKVNKELFPDYVRPARETPEREEVEEEEEEEKDGGVDLAQHGAQMEDRHYNNKTFETPDIDPSDPQQQEAALRIQTKYRQHHAKQEVQSKRQENAAIKIQAGARGMKDRKRVTAMKMEADSKSQQAAEEADRDDQEHEETVAAAAAAEEEEAKQQKDAEEVDIDLNDPEVEAAATKIQAGFKGYKARKEVQDMKNGSSESTVVPSGEPEGEEVDIDLDDPEVAAAAIKIQAGFKGYTARKELTAAKESQEKSKSVEEVNNSKQTADEDDEEIDIDLDDPEVEKAAYKIQAGFKGLKARKQVQAMRDEKEKGDESNSAEDVTSSKPGSPSAPEKPSGSNDEDIDIDLNDPEVEAAAYKIQAGFKGFKARKEVQGMREGQKTDLSTQDGDKKDAQEEEEEEVDIDLEDPEVEKAAYKIQAGFKGMKARKEVKALKDGQGQAEEAKKAEHAEAVAVEQGEADATSSEQGDVEGTASEQGEADETPREQGEADETPKEQGEADETPREQGEADETPREQGEADGTPTEQGEADETPREQGEADGTPRLEKDEAEDKKEVEQTAEIRSESPQQDKGDDLPKETQEDAKDTENAVVDKTEDAPAEPEEDKGDADAKEDDKPDIDLTDPEVEAAATKIQAGFKGMKARKEVKEMKDGAGSKETEAKDEAAEPAADGEAGEAVAKEGGEEVDIDLDDPEVQAAAEKIQAGFKGYKARKDAKEGKISGWEGAGWEGAEDTDTKEGTDPKAEDADTKQEGEDERKDL